MFSVYRSNKNIFIFLTNNDVIFIFFIFNSVSRGLMDISRCVIIGLLRVWGGEEPGASKMFVYCAVRECEIGE